VTPRQTVAETAGFIRDAEHAGLDERERAVIVDVVAADPSGGVEVVGSGGIRKVRIAGRGKGKSGGYRIMVAYLGPALPAYILALLSKGERANFSAGEIADMRSLTSEIRRFWSKRHHGQAGRSHH
jgi:hypothetical protein